MKVDVTVHPLKNSTGKTKAFCDVTFNEAVVIKGFTIVEGTSGLFCSPPRQKGKDKDGSEKWFDQVMFTDPEFGKKVKAAVLAAFNGEGQSANQGKNTTLPGAKPKTAPKPQIDSDDPF